MRSLSLILFILLCVCAGSTRTLAQDATLEPTQEVSPVTIINNPDTTPVDASEPWYAKYVAIVLTVLGTIAATLYGGIAALTRVLATLNRWLESLKTNPTGMDLAEKSYARAPDRLKAIIVPFIKEFIRLGGNFAEIQQEVEDGDLYTSKPHTSPVTPDSSTISTHTLASPSTDIPHAG